MPHESSRHGWSRRDLGRVLLSAAPAALWPARPLFAEETLERPTALTLGIGTYGMPSLTTEDALSLSAESGFDSVELALMSDWDAAPEKLTGPRRRALRTRLGDSGLALTALMEDLPPAADEAGHKRQLDRLTRAAELGRDLAPDRPPLIQSVLGGGVWEEKKQLFRDRVGDWLKVAESHKVVVAIKPHRFQAMNRPEQAAWLLDQLGKSPWLGIVFDYSHFVFREMPIAEVVKTAAPFTVHIAIKDAVMRDGRVEFALPGEAGTIDYVEILKEFLAAGYRGDVNCEVSSQVFRRPGYDAAAAARTCYRNMAAAFQKAGVARRTRGG